MRLSVYQLLCYPELLIVFLANARGTRYGAYCGFNDDRGSAYRERLACLVLAFVGFRSSQVFRHNHVGDWGTQFGMLINYMKEAYPNFLTDPPNITDLTTFYKAAKLRFDESDEFKEVKRVQCVAFLSQMSLDLFLVLIGIGMPHVLTDTADGSRAKIHRAL